MPTPEHEIPPEWCDELDELRQRVAGFPEDDEDRLIREGEAIFATMTPEEQARITGVHNEMAERMQTPENRDAIDRFFGGLGQ